MFLTVSKSTHISNFMKFRQVKTELLHAVGSTDGQTDVTKLIVTFRNYVNRSKMGLGPNRGEIRMQD